MICEQVSAEGWWSGLDDDPMEGLRECDTCGRLDDAGGYPDWVHGSCEVCDPQTIELTDSYIEAVLEDRADDRRW